MKFLLLPFFFQKAVWKRSARVREREREREKSYLKKKSCENAREWKLRIWDPKQKTNFARELDTSPPSLSPPRARFDWGPRAYERCWKPRRCTHEARTTSPWTHRREKIRLQTVRSTYFLFTPASERRPKTQTLLGGKKLTHRQENTTRTRTRKKRREHAHVLLRASVHTQTH